MTQDAVQPRQASGLSVAGWPLRRKLALALAIPLLLAATLGGLRVQGDLADASNAATSADQVTVLAPAVDYLTAAETAMVAAQGSSTASQGDLLDAIDDITRTSEELQQAADGAELNDLQAAHVESLLDLSQAIRSEEAADLGPATWIALVRQLESSVSQLITSVNAAQNTPEPRLEQLSQALSGRLSLAMQQALIANEDLAQSGSQELFSEIGVEASAIDRLAGSVEGLDSQTAALRSANTTHAGEVRDDAATDLGGRDAYLPYDEITSDLLAGVEDSLNAAASSERRNALLGAVVTVAALAAAVALALMITRMLLEPIGRVREGALAVARQKLPDAVARIRAGEEPEPIRPIDVTTNEEIGQVARAVDDLHRQAIHLASGEAQLRQTVNAMFVTLSRRSNSLVNQQLAQIERLEQDEEDPKRLESLFRLDHLASRMRRTADSLLILADAPNKAAGQFSLTVGEALQAATSGVQDYQRVQILSHLGTRISEDAAADVVHLLTELVDNALTFSPPAEPVRLNASLGTDGVTITVVDSGLGVPASELEQFNADLSSGVQATPETARRMGLFVVSKLAERHGVTAKLTKNPGGGLSATVVLPPAILPELPQPVARPTRTTLPETAASTEVAEVAGEETEGKRRSRSKSRSDKAAEKAAEKAAAKAAKDAAKEQAAADKAAEKAAEKADKAAREQADADSKAADAAAAKAAEATAKEEADRASAEPAAAANAAPAAPPSVAPDLNPGAGDPDRPPLESLLPRREPGANMPRTGADAFLPPETSAASGPLFGRKPAATDGDGTTDAPATPAEKVAPVVPITALAARQRAQAEEEARASEAVTGGDTEVESTQAEAEQVETEQAPIVDERAAESAEPAAEAEESVAEQAEPVEPAAEEPAPPVAEQPVRSFDPLSDPLPVEEPTVAEAEPEPEPEPQPEPQPEPVVETTPEPEPELEAAPEPSYGTGLGSSLGGLAGGLPTRTRGAAPEINRDMPGLPSSAPAEPEAPAARADVLGGGLGGGLAGGLPTRTRGAAPEINRDMPGLPSTNGTGESSRNGGDSPIFRSMRSGWLAGDGQGEWHETEVDRGWEIAEHVAEEAPVVESTSAGLPRRQPGERLVPGSVTPPSGSKTRDPEAIRRRLQSHAAGVSRGRRAANSSSQHTEAGPA